MQITNVTLKISKLVIDLYTSERCRCKFRNFGPSQIYGSFVFLFYLYTANVRCDISRNNTTGILFLTKYRDDFISDYLEITVK